MAVPVELEIFMRDLTKAGLQSVGKNVEGVESQTRRLIAALEQVRAEQLNQLNAAKKAGQSYTTEAANVQALTGQINGLKAGLKELQKEQAAAGATPNTRTLKGQSYCSQRWANPVWPKGSKSRGFSRRHCRRAQAERTA